MDILSTLSDTTAFICSTIHDYLPLTISCVYKDIHRKMVMNWLRLSPHCYETATDIISSYPLLFHVAPSCRAKWCAES
jgi:hypothetical protein